MAKSIFEILDSLQTETSVPEVKDKDGKIVRKGMGNVEHSLPRSLFPTAEIFASAEKLQAWAEENGFMHALLQQGIQKGLIDCRAKFKAIKKEETWTEKTGQKSVNEHRWEIVERPKGTSTAKIADARYGDCMAMLSNLLMAGIAKDAAITAIKQTYGDELVQNVLNGLNKKANE